MTILEVLEENPDHPHAKRWLLRANEKIRKQNQAAVCAPCPANVVLKATTSWHLVCKSVASGAARENLVKFLKNSASNCCAKKRRDDHLLEELENSARYLNSCRYRGKHLEVH